jgi:iron complex outermembrane receptor protein
MRHIFRLMMGTSIVLTHSTIALAQSSGGAPAPNPSRQPAPDATPDASRPKPSAQNAAGDIIVTATRRSESLQKVPISLAVVSGKTLEAFHATDLRSALETVPNVSIVTASGNDVIYVRGFGSAPTNFAFDQSVALYVDGIYAGRTRQILSPFFDLERTEVLRGPQGALYGKNTPAGAINILTANPSDHFEGAATGSYNFDEKGYDVSGHVSGPIAQGLTARLALRGLDQDGYIRNLFNGKKEPHDKQQVARLTLRYAATEDFDYTVKLNYGHRRVNGLQSTSSSLETVQMPRLYNYVEGVGPLGPNGFHTTNFLASGSGNVKLGDFTLTSVTGYSWFKVDRANYTDQLSDGVVIPQTVETGLQENFRQYSQELRLASPTVRKIEFIGGVYADNSIYNLGDSFNFDFPAPANLHEIEHSDFRQKSWSYSVYGQATYHILDALRLVGSLRYSHTIKHGDYAGKLVTGPFPILPITSANGRISEGHLDPSITAQYDIGPHAMVYATYGRGSKSGGFVGQTFGTTNANFSFKPELSKNIELGLKSTLAGGQLRMNIALYKMTVSNLQVSIFNPATTSFDVSNAAKATSKGIETSVSWFPNRHFDLTAAATYQDVKYKDYPGAACIASEPLSQCNPNDPTSVAINNLAGEPLTYASKFAGSFQAHHQLELPGATRLDTTVSVTGRTKYFTSDSHSPLYGRQPGYAKIDARLSFGPDDEIWHVAVVGKNLTNKLTVESSFEYGATITPAPRAILLIDDPRTVSVELGLRF